MYDDGIRGLKGSPTPLAPGVSGQKTFLRRGHSTHSEMDKTGIVHYLRLKSDGNGDEGNRVGVVSADDRVFIR